MVIESILINFERCSVNSVGCRTLEAELVTLAKVLAACSQMLTMDMISVARFSQFRQWFCQVWLGCGLWQVQRVRITLSFHITFTLFTNQNNLAFLTERFSISARNLDITPSARRATSFWTFSKLFFETRCTNLKFHQNSTIFQFDCSLDDRYLHAKC